MGLVNARNLRKAKELLEQNRHKVGDIVGKATEKLDQVSGGKTANLSKKAEDAARKYSAGGAPAPEDIGSGPADGRAEAADVAPESAESPLPPPPLRPPPPPPPA